MEPKGNFHIELTCILDIREIQIRKQVIVQVKVQWKHYSKEEATWEREEIMRQNFLALFPNFNNTE